MAGKSKRNVPRGEGGLAKAKDRIRNRASPACVVSLKLSPDQKDAVKDMELGPMLDIKCSTLHNPLINWLAPKYDRFSRSFVIPGRGRIPLTASSVYHSMGLPRGDVHVRYALDREVEARLRPVLFPGCATTPETTKVFTILNDMTTAGKEFKQIYIMYLISTVLAPTSLNKVSSRCYPIMDKVDDVKNMNLCQFVCDKLHDELSVGKLSAACLLHMMLFYVDSLDVSGLNIELPEGTFLVNIWSKANVEAVLDADMKRDVTGFGNLELKPLLAIDHCFFGGTDGFQGFIDTNCARNCPKPRKEKVARLVGEFSAGMTRLLATLVQGWTEVDDCDATDVEKSFGEISRQLGVESGSPNMASAEQNMSTPTPRQNRADDIPRPSPNVATTQHSMPTVCPFTTKPADIPMPSPNLSSPRNKQATSSPCANNADDIHMPSPNVSIPKNNLATSSPPANKAADIICPSAHSFSKGYTSDNAQIVISPASGIGRVTLSSSSSKSDRDAVRDQVETMVCGVEQSVSSDSQSDSEYYACRFIRKDRDPVVEKGNKDVGGSVGVDCHGTDEAAPKVLSIDIDNNVVDASSSAHHSVDHPPGATNTSNTGIFQSSHNKREMIGNMPTRMASSYAPEVVVSKKAIVSTLKRQVTKVEQKRTRSSPRFAVKENVKTGASCESKGATTGAVEVEKDVSQIEAEPSTKVHSITEFVDSNIDKMDANAADDNPPGATTMFSTDIFQSGNKKRKMEDFAPTTMASPYVPEIVVSKKARVATPKRKASKVEQHITRSSPRFSVKENVNTGPSCESKEAIAAAVKIVPIMTEVVDSNIDKIDAKASVGKASLRTSKGATLVKFEAAKPQLCYNMTRDLEKGGDPETIYVTPAMPIQPVMSAASITPGTCLRIGRIVQPSRFLLPPYSQIISTPEQDDLYEQVVKHHSKCKESKINSLMFLSISPMWVNTGDLADSIMPTGELSNTVVEIGISVLQESCDSKKIIFPHILTDHLLRHKFDSKVVQHNFRRDGKYKLSHKDVLLFAVLQQLGTAEKPQGHWYTLGLNFKAMRFEVLDSCRGCDDVSLIHHASFLVDAIKTAYRINYSTSAKQIDNYQLQYIDVPKQKNRLDCGYFMLRFLEQWDGRNVPAVTFDQIPAYRKILLWTWLNHKRNKLLNWRQLLEGNKL